jgi:hypothetical protein
MDNNFVFICDAGDTWRTEPFGLELRHEPQEGQTITLGSGNYYVYGAEWNGEDQAYYVTLVCPDGYEQWQAERDRDSDRKVRPLNNGQDDGDEVVTETVVTESYGPGYGGGYGGPDPMGMLGAAIIADAIFD